MLSNQAGVKPQCIPSVIQWRIRKLQEKFPLLSLHTIHCLGRSLKYFIHGMFSVPKTE